MTKDICLVCAWRADCQKRFSMKAGQSCPDFVRDVTIPKDEEEKVEEIKVKRDER